MAKKTNRDGFHMVDGKQTDTKFHEEDLTEKKESEFLLVISKLYHTK